VVEDGPYRWVRHPSYTGLILTFVGFGLALGNWAALAVVAVVPTAGLVYRMRVEERALLDGLGEPSSTQPASFENADHHYGSATANRAWTELLDGDELTTVEGIIEAAIARAPTAESPLEPGWDAEP
jgi:phospholipid methyltransferase